MVLSLNEIVLNYFNRNYQGYLLNDPDLNNSKKYSKVSPFVFEQRLPLSFAHNTSFVPRDNIKLSYHLGSPIWPGDNQIPMPKPKLTTKFHLNKAPKNEHRFFETDRSRLKNGSKDLLN
jgi:hypothetical protein